MSHDTLIQRLREYYTDDADYYSITHPICDEAADALEAQQAELASQENRITILQKACDLCLEQVRKSFADAAQLRQQFIDARIDRNAVLEQAAQTCESLKLEDASGECAGAWECGALDCAIAIRSMKDER